MQHADYIAAIRREGDALDRAARAAGIDAPVVSCPGWTVADLLSHVARLHRWVTDIVVQRPADPSVHWKQTEAPAGDALFEFFASAYPALADALEAAGPDAEAWSWTRDHTTGFWARRHAHELAVHRWDGQTASGATEPVDATLAVDGIQEVFDLLPARFADTRFHGTGETIHVHCTDVDGEWLLRMTPDGLLVTREHAKGDVAARGTASDLVLFLWGRVDPSALEVFGDVSLLERWREQAQF